jgi:glyoxylase-like metal-dependent hydrolase (beta-lactamase superfamily II)
MHILSGGRLRMKRRIYVPDAESSELIELPVMCFLLRHEQGNVLFDTGCHPQAAVDPESRWGDLAKAMKLISPADENLITGLDAVGLQPSDIDVVVNSHFHPDHCGCNEFFKKATVVCHAKELEAATAPAGEKAGFLAKDWRHPNRFDTLDSQRDLFGDGDIVLVPVPGHTPGTTAALVTLERSGSYLLASDAVPLQDHLDREYNPRNTWNPDLSLRSIAEIKRIHASGTKVIFGHDAEQFRTLKKGPDFYE